MSSETLQLSVQYLNRDPFNVGTTIIAFDSFPSSKLLQILSDVICWINSVPNVDITRESAEETAMRILNSLRILKYKPPTDIELLEEWRAGIVEGSKASVYPVLGYLFSNVEMLKERAYLAKFLVKVEIPSEVHDMDTAQLQAEMAELMERFKEIHSQVVEVRQDSMILDDIRGDLKSMESEKDALTRKIEKAERKVQNLPGLEKYMASAEELRAQKDRVAELTMQRSEQRDGVIHAEQKLQRLRTQLTEVQAAGENIDPSDLIAQLEDEIATNTYMVHTKLSTDINAKRQIVEELSKVSDMPAIDQKDLNELQEQVTTVSNRIMALEEERDRSEEGLEDNFSIFRHQAAAVERKKDGVAQKLQEARQELARMEGLVEEKKNELKTRSGVDVISGKEFRTYVNHLRGRTAEYKKKRQELDELVSEKGTLVRTMEMLSAKYNDLKERIESMGGEVEEQVEVPVPQRPRTAAPRSDDVDELRQMITELMARLDEKRDEIEPLKRKKDQNQTKFNESSEFVRSKREEFERRKEQLEQGYATLKQEVEELEQRQKEATSDVENVTQKIEEAQKTLDELQREGDGLKDRLEEQLSEAQQEADDLSKRGGSASNDTAHARQQVLLWKSLLQLFEAKMSAVNEEKDGFN